MYAISQEECDLLSQMVGQAGEPIPPFWPMQSMVAKNPLHRVGICHAPRGPLLEGCALPTLKVGYNFIVDYCKDSQIRKVQCNFDGH